MTRSLSRCVCGASLEGACFVGAMSTGESAGESLLLVNCPTCRTTRSRGTNGAIVGFVRFQAVAARLGVSLAVLLEMRGADVQARLLECLVGGSA